MKEGDKLWKYYDYGLFVDSYLGVMLNFELFSFYTYDLDAKFYPFYIEPLNFHQKMLRFEAVKEDTQPWDMEIALSYGLQLLFLKSEVQEDSKTLLESIFESVKNKDFESVVPQGSSDITYRDNKYQSTYIDPYFTQDFAAKYLKLGGKSWYGPEHKIWSEWLLGNY